MRWLLIIVLCVAAPPCVATLSFESLLEKANAVRSANPEEFRRVLRQLNDRTETATPIQLQQLRYFRAYNLTTMSDFEGSNRELKPLFHEASEITLKYKVSALIANNYAISRQFTEGLRALDETLSLAKEIHDPELRQEGLLVAPILYNQLGQYELGRHFAELVLSETRNERTRCFAGNLFLEAQLNINIRLADEERFASVLKQCVDQNESVAVGITRSYLARLRYANGKVENATAMLEQHLSEIEATRYPRLIGDVHSLLAEYKLKLGEIAQAEHHANIAVKVSVSIPFSPALVVSEKTLYEIALHRNDTASALEHFKKYAEADKAYLNDVKARELAYQLVKHETQQKTQTIDLLNKKNEVLQLEQTVAKQKAHYTAILVALLVLLLAMLLLWAYRTKRMQIAFRRLAETDTLTGISNRDHFAKLAERAISEASRKAEPLGMIMFDLDNFKSINDRFGHSTGDWVLQQVIAACKPICRKQDCFGRIGGEEFAILLHASDLSSATDMAERFRKHIAAIDTSETGHDFTVTASFGVTTTVFSGYIFDALLSNADQTLYQSKREGRNRVSTFDRLKSGTDIAEEAAIGL